MVAPKNISSPDSLNNITLRIITPRWITVVFFFTHNIQVQSVRYKFFSLCTVLHLLVTESLSCIRITRKCHTIPSMYLHHHFIYTCLHYQIIRLVRLTHIFKHYWLIFNCTMKNWCSTTPCCNTTITIQVKKDSLLLTTCELIFPPIYTK